MIAKKQCDLEELLEMETIDIVLRLSNAPHNRLAEGAERSGAAFASPSLMRLL